MQVFSTGQAHKEHAQHSWRKLAFDITLAVILAVAAAVLIEWVKDALADPPCESEAVVHRLVIAPDARPRCLTAAADVRA